MEVRQRISTLGFTPKEGHIGVFHKVYGDVVSGYSITVDLTHGRICYGDKISCGNGAILNFQHPENFVVLECVDRLLRKGYQPQYLALEKTWPSGHGTSGRLDICVNREDGTPFLLIECKTYGKEFAKASRSLHKDGGQLFSYFQLSGCKADFLMLYASDTDGQTVTYVNEIVKVEEEYRGGETKDIYDKWNKLTKDHGIFDEDAHPYHTISKALTKERLKEISSEDSSFIFNRFLEILRHNVVSDKGNAFNKIFSLFLCKVYDETTTPNGEELAFQWLEGRDTHESFQLRLAGLYRKGMSKFLNRNVSDFDEADFEKRCANLTEGTRRYLRNEMNRLRLERNNEFAIKEVYDAASFAENAKVVREVVELIQGYRIRYNRRQQYLSDFFELLLTTGLKQEVGQYFTPVPIARFVIRGLPLSDMVSNRLARKDGDILPYMIDYAAGSGHFITEYMHEVQDLLNAADESRCIDETRMLLDAWRKDNFRWATKYVYGVEKDYRLVKVGKVGCYLHGDGLANVILSDGLASFHKNNEYSGNLRKTQDDHSQDNQRFDVLLSNPPYSVSAFRQTTRNYYSEEDFELYNHLTDNSSEIECLFVERAKQLLREGGVAGLILPNSVMSNGGIYAKTRELILRYFDLVAVAEFGAGTFMATSTNTVALFLRRRDNYFADNTRKQVDEFFRTCNDVSVNGIETPVAKYVAKAWRGLDFDDYVTLLRQRPNDRVEAHDLYVQYRKIYASKPEDVFWELALATERDKLHYFIMCYPQQVVILKSGEKDEEKRFLGYEFSNRRGNEGIHAVARGKNIEQCTLLFNPEDPDDPEKASTYVRRAFCGDYASEISAKMKRHVCRLPLSDMLTFDSPTFDKRLSTAKKAKTAVGFKCHTMRVRDVITPVAGATTKIPEAEIRDRGEFPVLTQDSTRIIAGYADSDAPITDVPLILFGDHTCVVKYADTPFLRGADGVVLLKPGEGVNPKYFFHVLQYVVEANLDKSRYERHNKYLQDLQVPIASPEEQERVIEEIDAIDDGVANSLKLIDRLRRDIGNILQKTTSASEVRLGVAAPFATETTNCDEIASDAYVTTDNMLPDMGGIVPAKSMARNGSVAAFKENDILISNIRPYLKKIWLADKSGGCSRDVLVVRSSDESLYLPKFIYLMLASDAFFDYVMDGKRGLKMPRGDRKRIEQYRIPTPSPDTQREVVERVEELYRKIADAQKSIDAGKELKRAALERHLM